jgi:hypothetical protein
MLAFTTTDSGGVCLWDFRAEKKQWTVVRIGHPAVNLAFSPDGQILATSNRGDPNVHLLDSSSGVLLRVCAVGDGDYHALSWSPDGRLLAAGDGRGNVHIFKAANGRKARVLPGLGNFGTAGMGDWRGFMRNVGLAVSPEGDYRALPNLEKEILYVAQTDHGQETFTPDEFAKKYGWKNDPERLQVPTKPIEDQWFQAVAAMKPDQQVRAVEAKLQERNLFYGGGIESRVEKGAVVEIRLIGKRVTDFTPLRSLPLKTLYLWESPITDLSSLRGLKLETLSIARTRVRELSPLKGMQLKILDCGESTVADLSALEGMTSLENLACQATAVRDLSPLRGLRLKKILCSPTSKGDWEVLRSLKTLEVINGKPAAQLWKERDAQKPAKP